MSRAGHSRENPERSDAAYKLTNGLFKKGLRIGSGHADEAMLAELGERAVRGLAAENQRPYGIPQAADAIARRAGTRDAGFDGDDIAPEVKAERRRW